MAGEYRKEIDGLRALAVGAVVLYHAGVTTLSGGFAGVDVFFVISGFLITGIVLRQIDAGRFSFRQFYERRARRIIPMLYLVTLFAMIGAYLLMPPFEMRQFAIRVVAVALFVPNVAYWWHTSYFSPGADRLALLHTWSLGVEEQFYLLFPLLLVLCARWRRQVVVPVLAGLALASLALAQWGAHHVPAAAFFLLPFRAWELLAGALCAAVPGAADRLAVRWHGLLAGLGVAAIGASFFLLDHTSRVPGLVMLLPVAGTVLVILFGAARGPVNWLLCLPPMTALGLTSYSLYLWHQPLLVFARMVDQDGLSPGEVAALLGFAFAISILSWRFIEQPFRRGSGGVSGATASRAPVRWNIFGWQIAGALVLFAYGYFGHRDQGNFGRYDERSIMQGHDRAAWMAGVWKRKDELRLVPFAADGRTRILVVGDSNSGDFVNALEAAAPGRFSISTALVRAYCLIDFLGFEVLDPPVRHGAAFDCSDGDTLASPRLRERMREADVIVVAAFWSGFDATRFRQGYARSREAFGDKFWFFGTKDLMAQDLFAVLTGRQPLFSSTLRKPSDAARKANAALGAQTGVRLIDPFALSCPDDACPINEPDGSAIVFDGFHLTPLGHRKLGETLVRNGYLDAFDRMGSARPD